MDNALNEKLDLSALHLGIISVGALLGAVVTLVACILAVRIITVLLRRVLGKTTLEQRVSKYICLLYTSRQTEAIAPADVVVQAGPFPADVPRELPGADGELQCPAHRLDGKTCLPAATEGAEVPGAVLLRLSRQSEPGVGGPGVQPDEGVSLVVLEQDVVSVSYTHLDVYKRQGVERWPRIRSPNRWTMTPPPSILDSRAMLSP